MAHNDHVDFDLYELVQGLIDQGDIVVGTPTYGIAQQVISSGYGSLTSKDRVIYDAVLAPVLKRQAEWREFDRIKNSASD